MKIIQITLLLLIASVAQSATVTLDFEEFTVAEYGTNPNLSAESAIFADNYALSYTNYTHGLTILNDISSYSSRPHDIGSNTAYAESLKIEAVNDSFNLLAFDIASVDVGTASRFYVRGYRDGVIVASNYLYFWNNKVTTYGDSELSDFTDLSSVVFTTANIPIQIDNIVVRNTPLPATAWLFGSALLGLVGFKFRKFSNS